MNVIKKEEVQVAILVSANSEWNSVIKFYHDPTVQKSPFGTYFFSPVAGKSAVFFQGGWGKISAAASAQYVIDRWEPELIVNIGTCGGLSGKTQVGELLLVEQTLVYDIYERMGDSDAATAFYTTQLDLSFLSEPFPQTVRKSRLISADQDIDPDLVHKLVGEYSAIAADWESGAIAWTAKRNRVRCLILRGVSDLVDSVGGEIYDSSEFHNRANDVMIPMLKALPNWIRCASWSMK